MDEQFDNKLKNHIRKVFEDFEDPSADAGWLLLRERFPEKKKDRGVIWLWLGSAAAILLLALGIGIRINFKKDDTTRLALKPGKIYHQNKPVQNGQQLVKKQNMPNVVDNNGTNLAANISPVSHLPAKTQKHISTIPGSKTGTSKPVVNNTDEKLAANKQDERPAIANNKVTDRSDLAINKTAVTQSANPTGLAKDSATKKNSIAVLPPSVVKTANPFLTNKQDDPKEHKKTDPVKTDNIDKKVEYGVYAATYVNYAKNVTTNLNIGVGFTADIKLTDHLKLATGIAIAQNTLNISSVPGSYTTQYSLSAPTAAGNITSSALNQYSASAVAPTNLSVASVRTLTSSDAQLVALDVPVNLKYEFTPQKNKSYVAVGLSSGMFINQSYTNQYFYPIAQKSGNETNTSNFSDFYLAKTLNVSFGLGYPLGKNRLVIEPFVKYPLDGLGAQQMRFGAGGLNLKFDFLNAKK